jgi:hypothetical protein
MEKEIKQITNIINSLIDSRNFYYEELEKSKDKTYRVWCMFRINVINEQIEENKKIKNWLLTS